MMTTRWCWNHERLKAWICIIVAGHHYERSHLNCSYHHYHHQHYYKDKHDHFTWYHHHTFAYGMRMQKYFKPQQGRQCAEKLPLHQRSRSGKDDVYFWSGSEEDHDVSLLLWYSSSWQCSDLPLTLLKLGDKKHSTCLISTYPVVDKLNLSSILGCVLQVFRSSVQVCNNTFTSIWIYLYINIPVRQWYMKYGIHIV